jgi:hypothetical protein
MGSSVYDPKRHEALAGDVWKPEVVRNAIARIVSDFLDSRETDGSWRSHPLDVATGEPKWAAYFGAAGALVSLRILEREGYDVPRRLGGWRRIHAAYLESPDVGYQTGLQLGEIGILAPALLDEPGDVERAARLSDCMARTIGHPAREITSGETGMIHAALTLYRATGDPRWEEWYRRGARSLWDSWHPHGDGGQWHWTSDIFGFKRHYFGANHGVAGNAQALVRGADLLPAEWIPELLERTVRTLVQGAVRDGDDLNWPVSNDDSGKRRLIQWCHGAPGVVAALAGVPRADGDVSVELDALLRAAGELIWKAGPLVKGSSLCHGTAGNGFALLELFRRTRDERWLERARRFAMHAIAQCDAARSKYGQGRYTLWTGDGGLAVYLHQCLDPSRKGFPGLELL